MKSTIRRVAASVALVPARFDGAVKAAALDCFARARQLDKRKATAFALAALAMTVAAEPAFAQSGGGQTDITTIFQNVANLITGNAGKIIAVIAIAILGFGALTGALSLRAAGGVVLGIALIFSAAWLVNQILGA